ncbi:MAG: UDP-N-acetylmuramoyl-tripeptide--D-alanyl-D-alanine ligase [Acidimicrobiia bacterium]|nr:UDP-N-acetylmuramoyl-tripeptide--D-alanyl-D-alanine ligase [Acidimicrobiia bacterium]
MNWSLAQIAAITGGTLIGPNATVSSVGTDSRDVAEGSLFVALKGEAHDGHRFVESALAAGAAGVLVERGQTVEPRVEVEDTLAALLALGSERRNELSIPVIAITGSSGKTSTKDFAVAALPNAHGSPRSFNNEIGVPLTVLGTPSDAAHLVMEVGSRGRGHIASLMGAVRPDVAIITNLGVVHMETFGTPAGLAAAKWEIVDALEESGVAVLPVDEPRLLPPTRVFAGRTITFGGTGADVAVEGLQLDSRGCPTFRLSTPIGSGDVQLGVIGAHHALNAAAAVAAGVAVNAPLDVMMAGLTEAQLSPWRMERHDGRFTVINDAYNANPDSMAAALRLVADLPGRSVAILGKMAELGHLESSEHQRLGRLASALGFAELIIVGEDPGLALGAGAIATSVDSHDEAAEAARSMVRDGDVVLVKASRSVGLETLASNLAEDAKR